MVKHIETIPMSSKVPMSNFTKQSLYNVKMKGKSSINQKVKKRKLFLDSSGISQPHFIHCFCVWRFGIIAPHEGLFI